MSKDKYTTIQIAEEDKIRLLGIAMDIMEFNGQKEPMKPVNCIHHAINALDKEFKLLKTAVDNNEIISEGQRLQ